MDEWMEEISQDNRWSGLEWQEWINRLLQMARRVRMLRDKAGDGKSLETETEEEA